MTRKKIPDSKERADHKIIQSKLSLESKTKIAELKAYLVSAVCEVLSGWRLNDVGVGVYCDIIVYLVIKKIEKLEVQYNQRDDL